MPRPGTLLAWAYAIAVYGFILLPVAVLATGSALSLIQAFAPILNSPLPPLSA